MDEDQIIFFEKPINPSEPKEYPLVFWYLIIVPLFSWLSFILSCSSIAFGWANYILKNPYGLVMRLLSIQSFLMNLLIIFSIAIIIYILLKKMNEILFILPVFIIIAPFIPFFISLLLPTLAMNIDYPVSLILFFMFSYCAIITILSLYGIKKLKNEPLAEYNARSIIGIVFILLYLIYSFFIFTSTVSGINSCAAAGRATDCGQGALGLLVIEGPFMFLSIFSGFLFLPIIILLNCILLYAIGKIISLFIRKMGVA